MGVTFGVGLFLGTPRSRLAYCQSAGVGPSRLGYFLLFWFLVEAVICHHGEQDCEASSC